MIIVNLGPLCPVCFCGRLRMNAHLLFDNSAIVEQQ